MKNDFTLTPGMMGTSVPAVSPPPAASCRAFFLGDAMKLTQNCIREEDLTALIKWAELSNDMILRALLELKQRRAEDRQREYKYGSDNA